MLRLSFFIGLKEERDPRAGGGGWSVVGVIGPNSSSAISDGWEDSSNAAVARPLVDMPDGSVSSLVRFEAENPPGDRMWVGPTLTRRAPE